MPDPLSASTDDPQRGAQASHALADGTASARLTVKTVADPTIMYCPLKLLLFRLHAVAPENNHLGTITAGPNCGIDCI